MRPRAYEPASSPPHIRIICSVLALLSLAVGMIFGASSAQSVVVRGSSCQRPYKDYRDVFITVQGDRKASIRYTYKYMDDGTHVDWIWKPRPGYVVCRAVVQLHRGVTHVVTNPKGSHYSYVNPWSAQWDLLVRLTVYTRKAG